MCPAYFASVGVGLEAGGSMETTMRPPCTRTMAAVRPVDVPMHPGILYIADGEHIKGKLTSGGTCMSLKTCGGIIIKNTRLTVVGSPMTGDSHTSVAHYLNPMRPTIRW